MSDEIRIKYGKIWYNVKKGRVWGIFTPGGGSLTALNAKHKTQNRGYMRLKILLVNPPRVSGYPVVREERFEHKDIGSVYPPLSLLYMAAVLEKNPSYEVSLLDANGRNLSLNSVYSEIAAAAPDVVVARCAFDTQKEDLEVLRAAKALGAITVLRSKIAADVPQVRDEILRGRCTDIFIDSEPEAVLPALMEALYKSKKELLVKSQPLACLFDPDCRASESFWNYLDSVPGITYYYREKITTVKPAPQIADPDSIPFPAWHLLPSLKHYHTGVLEAPFVLVQTTRGCPFACTFCAFGKSKHRERDVEPVIAELKVLRDSHKIKSFLFFDDIISLKKGRIEELCRRMKEEGLDKLKWAACTRADLVTKDMLKAMKDAGMKEIAIGIETGSETVLKNIKKGVSLNEIRQAAKWCKELKIMFYGLAIIGLPGETEETVKETVEFIKEIDPFYTQFCFSTPFPNTEIYEWYKSKNFLLTDDWSKYFPLADKPVVRTEALSDADLIRLRSYAYSKILMRPLYLLRQVRPFDLKWTMGGFVKIMERIVRLVFGKAVR